MACRPLPTRFDVGHATHPDAHMAVALAAAQIDGARARAGTGLRPPTLGFVYCTDRLAGAAEALLDDLRRRWPGVHWVGGSAHAVVAGVAEYRGEPAVALMLCDLPSAMFRLFSGRQPLPAPALRAGADLRPWTALVHAGADVAAMPDLLAELAQRTASGRLAGGIVNGRPRAIHVADQAWTAGCSGVAFAQAAGVTVGFTQGCQPQGPVHRITACADNRLVALDDEPALAVLRRTLGLGAAAMHDLVPALRHALVAFGAPGAALIDKGQLGMAAGVRRIIGVDARRQAVAIDARVEPGMPMVFCRHDEVAARRDLIRLCSQARDDLELAAEALPAPGDGAIDVASSPIAGAVYISSGARADRCFGGTGREMACLQHALGSVPVVGFHATAEVAGAQLHEYCGVLLAFPHGRPDDTSRR